MKATSLQTRILEIGLEAKSKDEIDQAIETLEICRAKRFAMEAEPKTRAPRGSKKKTLTEAIAAGNQGRKENATENPPSLKAASGLP